MTLTSWDPHASHQEKEKKNQKKEARLGERGAVNQVFIGSPVIREH